MNKLIAIEFNVAVTGEGSDEKTFEILNDLGIEIVDHYMNGDLLGGFKCRTDSHEKYYAVLSALEEEAIDFITFE